MKKDKLRRGKRGERRKDRREEKKRREGEKDKRKRKIHVSGRHWVRVGAPEEYA